MAQGKDGTSPTFPSRVNVNAGGKGGTVVLIAGVLFIGYLYLSRRLPSVFAAISTPPTTTAGSMGGNVPAQPTIGTPPINPGSGGGYGPAPYNSGFVQVTLMYPANSGIGTEVIQVDPRYCRVSVYGHVLARTANVAWAQAMAEMACRGLK